MRIVNDNYPTPEWCVKSLYKILPEMFAKPLDPGAGDGALFCYGSGYAIELDESHDPELKKRAQKIMYADALTVDWNAEELSGWESIVMNPPFAFAPEFVRKGLSYNKPLAALLRLSFLEPAKNRRDILALNPWVGILPRRPKFRSDRSGSDTMTCAWFVFNTTYLHGWEILS